jgi:energy-converting hydrogenase B subunit D
MNGFWALDYLCLLLILVCAGIVVKTGNLNAAVAALSGVGTLLTLLFVVLGAPDDALSEVVVGTIALPTLYFIAIGKTRTDVSDTGELGEEPGDRRNSKGK